MRILKNGGHRLFESDPETAEYVALLLRDLRDRGMDAVRDLSAKFDGWTPSSFELAPSEIERAISECSPQLIEDTAFCQENVRRFAQAQMGTLTSLEVEIRPGV